MRDADFAAKSDQIEPGWHAWLGYMVDKAPTEDPLLRTGIRAWEKKEHVPSMSMSRGAFKTYST
jgi:NADH:ubiquinone oxidoreductase subunit